MARLINRIQRALLGGASEEKVCALLAELSIPPGGSGEGALRGVRNSILYPMDTDAELRTAFGNLGLTGNGTGERPLPRIRAAILRNLRDSEMTLRTGLNDMLSPLDLAGSAPTDIAWAGTHTIAENVALGTVVGGALSVIDPDVGDTVTYSLTNDAGGLFGISGTSVIVTGVIDYETATSYNIIIRATDSSGRTYDEVFTVTVTDVAETAPPVAPGAGTIIVDDPTVFETPPTVVAVNGAIAFQGKKKTGSSGKFIFDLGAAVAGQIYTVRYDPDWSLLENGGVTAMVGFGLRHSNDFRLSGLKGDGSSGLKAYEVFGASKWNQTSGFTTSDGGAAGAGTQGGPNWLQFEVAASGSTYTLRTSSNGTTWIDEFTAITPTPFANVSGVTSFGIAVFLEAADAGPFRVDITLWQAAPAVSYATLNGVATNATLSNGNLTAAHSNTTGDSGARSTTSKTSGKYYFEATYNTAASAGDCVGIYLTSESAYGQMVSLGRNCSISFGSGIVYSNDGQFAGPNMGAMTAGNVLSVAVDLTAGKCWFRRNGGAWNSPMGGSPNPATGVNGGTIETPSAGYVPAIGFTSGGSGNSVTMNFGASAFAYAVPSGFTAGWTI